MAYSGWEWWKNVIAGGVSKIRESILTFPSFYELLPTYQSCCVIGPKGTKYNELTHFDPLKPHDWLRFSWLPKKFQTQFGRDYLASVMNKARMLHSRILRAPIPSGVEFYPIVTGLYRTNWRVYIDAKDGRIIDWDTHFGDKTVHEYSAANGKLRLAKPSDKPHGHIFTGKAALQNLRWVLVSDTEPTAGRTSNQYRAVVIDQSGKKHQIEGVDLKISPSVVRAGETLEATLSLHGLTDLSIAEFRPDISILANNNVKSVKAQRIHNQGLPRVAKFIMLITAPGRAGVGIIKIKLPGINDDIQGILLITM
jgi:hypothetical protein